MKMYQINEDDLVELEKLVPSLSDSLAQHLNAANRRALRMCKGILSDVRWNYGPPENVEVIDVE